MGRPLDPTSRNQVDQRTRRLREPESGWIRGLSMTVALAALKAYQWNHYLENGGEPGPLAGTFPRLPEEPGSRVVVGAEEVVDPELVGHRLLVSHGGQTLTDGQATGLEVPDGEQLAKARELADLLESRHLRLLLTPSLHREAATWMGDLLAAPAPEDGPEPERIALGDRHPELGRVELADRTCLLGDLQDLWEVPDRPLGLASETYLGRIGTSREEAAMAAALWEFGRRLYRQLLNPRPDALERRGLERPTLLRQLLEELDLLEPGGLKTQPVGEKALARMTTHEVPMLGFRAFPRPDKWEEAEDGRGRFLHNPPRSERGYRRWELTLQEGREDLAFASLARCQQVLEKGGLELTALHGLLCCLVMQQADPGARFEVAGDDLLKDLGYGQARGGRDGSSRSDLLRKVASSATLLGAVRCEGNARNNRTGTRISMEFGPMWSISIRADGQLKLLEQPGEEQLGTLTDLTLTVTPGTWVQSQRVLLSSGGSHLLYVPVASPVLSLGRYRQELAFRLGIHLAMGVRERQQWKAGIANVRVGQLLEEVLPQGVLERALLDRRAAYDLRQQWNTALVTLHTVVGFRFGFEPGHYPAALIPEDLRPPEMGDPGSVLPGALEQLLASRLVIHWPELVVEAIHQKALPQRERETTFQARQQQRATLQSRPNGARLREALEQAKASGAIQSRAQAAARLQISTAYLSLLVNGKRDLSTQKLQRFLALLETFRPGKS